MINLSTKHLAISIILFLLSLQSVYATSTEELINIAGKQRMLSQKIAKAYFFYNQGIRPGKTRQQLQDSVSEFNKNYDLLKNKISDKNVQDMLAYIELSKDELTSLINAPYSKEKGTQMLDDSEALLEGSHDIVKQLEANSKEKKAAIINISGRQRMLTQRIAKYYIAYQAGFKDKNITKQLKIAMNEFESAHKALADFKKNTPEIKADLNKIAKLWNVVNKFYSKVEKGGLPVIVLSTTDKIMDTMNHATGLYVKLLSK